MTLNNFFSAFQIPQPTFMTETNFFLKQDFIVSFENSTQRGRKEGSLQQGSKGSHN
jgi:hypothetical protein